MENTKQKLLNMSEISLMLDTYDDIFSDFDPRPYSERTISDDFLSEAKKASRDKPSGEIELKFLIPVNKRNTEDEKLIRKRLHEHFRRHLKILKNDLHHIRYKGAITVLFGFVIMILAVSIKFLKIDEFLADVLLTIFEPAGWFTAWFGFDQLFYVSGTKKPDIEFYEKMSKCFITFMPY